MTQPSPPHHLYEDVLAILIGSIHVAVGVLLFRSADIPMGGTVGVAYLAHYASGLNFGTLFFLINLPFYVLAWRGMGRAFTIKTFAAVASLSVLSEWLPTLIHLDHINAVFAAIVGGLLVGNGLLVLIRHRASLGGLGVLAVYLQETRGWRAGTIQMLMDLVILGAAAWIIGLQAAALSVLASGALNMVIGVNHRRGRYLGC
ncbi:MAG TPA: YitT family protein [Denitromonas sp.]|uniref:YitT family protein n=1 Tax=Denitromonas sp. TaxID=2734609 RepID=UPI001D64F7B5|nr:YitT family protein [Rhodocyclaceae bacterium]MCP5223176.1 YitT family protein [Zoogloeaceae bacterium]HQU89003.1 YitT family protein [Denitromonas sp.]HQV14509.1 YitT family protein [Denitromonas sp.]